MRTVRCSDLGLPSPSASRFFESNVCNLVRTLGEPGKGARLDSHATARFLREIFSRSASRRFLLPPPCGFCSWSSLAQAPCIIPVQTSGHWGPSPCLSGNWINHWSLTLRRDDERPVCTCCGKLQGTGAKFCNECGHPVPAAGQSETPKKKRRKLDAAELLELAMKNASPEVHQEKTNDMTTTSGGTPDPPRSNECCATSQRNQSMQPVSSTSQHNQSAPPVSAINQYNQPAPPVSAISQRNQSAHH